MSEIKQEEQSKVRKYFISYSYSSKRIGEVVSGFGHTSINLVGDFTYDTIMNTKGLIERDNEDIQNVVIVFFKEFDN